MRITTMITGGLLTMALAGTAIAGPMGGRADMDKDGQVTKTELNAQIDARFKAMDTNGSGQIEMAEMEAAKQARKAKWAEKRAARTGEAATQTPGEKRGPMRAGKRGKMDANGDGIISREEFGAHATMRFDRVDTNGDGAVTKDERTAMKEARKARRAQSAM